MSSPVGNGTGSLEHRDRGHDSSSDDSDGDKKHKHSDKFHLFGRQKPVHSALGGGKPADIMLWRNKQVSASMLAAATVIWLLFERIGYHLLTFVCHALILLLALLFLWSNVSFFFNRSPLDFPEIVLPEGLCTGLALLLMDRFNQAFNFFREVASGRDLKKFLGGMLILWIVSKVGSWFDFLTLVYMVCVAMLTVPLLYEKHEDRVDAYAQQATVKLKKQYSLLDEKVLQKLPNIAPKQS
ncbi:OLC1v1006503C1 [Oldenlandia corymbosa var. corymbosa]|uniref:Reticulon-like protein n=1 Tax=Oldenlandia corymbosa var. corymbosa TaxID=529605 RepID=A0AAV1DJS7_OLDCO|nr:OLC1v1006503C1 [Oldenlandia corymbosa var. corymbosa]